MAKVVYTNVSDGHNVQGDLFKGITFWISLSVPQRSRFIQEVQANGGKVSISEDQVDIKIVDHLKKKALPGTYSYKYIETSVQTGILANLEEHAVGPPEGTIRSVGSTTHPARISRTKFTEDDDRKLWSWVQENPQKGGGTDGNEIYKQLEAADSRHTWQSWRSRWVDQLKGTRPAFTLTNAPPTPPSDQLEADQEHVRGQKLGETEERTKDLTNDAHALLAIGNEEKTRMESQIIEANKRNLEAQSKSSLKKIGGLEPTSSPPQRPKSSLMIPITRSRDQQILETVNDDASIAQLPRSNTAESQDVFYPSLEAQNDGHESPKRKFVDIVELDIVELPSSSPETRGPKRQRRERFSSDMEVPSTPEKSPIQQQVQSPSKAKQITASTEFNSISLSHEFDEHEEPYFEPTEEVESYVGQQTSPILSEPKHLTQAIFKEESVPIDYDVAPPDEGWDDSGSEFKPESTSESEIQNEAISQERTPQHADTQTLFNAETQIPEIDIPPPDGGWDADLQPSPPIKTESTPEPSPSEITALLDAWIDARVEAGHTADSVEFALQCTSMDHELADAVLAHLKAKGTIPDDMPGVWTEIDDADLEASDARHLHRLQAKHGSKAFDTRWRFIEANRSFEQ